MWYTISEIEYLPAQEHGSGYCPRKFEQLYVKVIGDNVATLIHLGTESTKPFPIEASKSDQLRIEVYSKHRFRSDRLIGCIEDSVARLSGHPNGGISVTLCSLLALLRRTNRASCSSRIQFEIKALALGRELSPSSPPPTITVTEPSGSVPGASVPKPAVSSEQDVILAQGATVGEQMEDRSSTIPDGFDPAIGQASSSKDDRLTPTFPNPRLDNGSSTCPFAASTSDLSKTSLLIETAKETIDRMESINLDVSRPAEVLERIGSTMPTA